MTGCTVFFQKAPLYNSKVLFQWKPLFFSLFKQGTLAALRSIATNCYKHATNTFHTKHLQIQPCHFSNNIGLNLIHLQLKIYLLSLRIAFH